MVAYTYYESDPRVIREAEAAVEGGFDVDFLALRRPGTPSEETVRGVRVIRLNQAKYRGGGLFRYLLQYGEFFIRCLARTTALFVTRRYKLIHVNNMPDCLVFSTIIPRLFGSKVILDIHDSMPNTFVSKFRGNENSLYYRALVWEERLSAAYCNRVLTVHQPIKESILMKHGLKETSIDVVANFADDELFAPRPACPLSDRVRFVFHGTILERSGLRLLMNSLAQVKLKDRIAVRIIGEGDFSESLKEMIESLDLSGIVEFDNHSYPLHAIPDLLADCHVGLVPLEISSATNYALPLKLLEYISMGIPVVSVRNEAISYYVNEEDCIFFEWDDESSLSSVLNAVAEMPQKLARYRERCLASRGRFSWAGEKKKYVSLLRQLTGVDATSNCKA